MTGSRRSFNLTLCPTPIGNLADATERQREALRAADVIACEDTRTTGKLLELLGIPRQDGRPRLVSYHEHNEAERAVELVDQMRKGARVVLVSDAGTPGISDPGYRLVHAAREAGLAITVLPGPNAAVTALAGSGLPSDRFVFEGFAPSKDSARRAAVERAFAAGITAVFYESPNRTVALLEAVGEVYGSVEVCVARELTKLHEEWLHGAVDQVLAELRSRESIKGEVVVVVGPGRTGAPEDDVDKWIEAMWAEDVKPQTIKSVVAAATGLKKSEVWQRLERLKQD